MKRSSRRQFLSYLGASFVTALSVRSGLNALAAGNASTRALGFTPDVEIDLVAAPGKVSVLPGTETDVWRYSAQVVSDPSFAVQPLTDTYLGPIMRWRKGQKIRVRFTNRIPEETIVH